MTVRVLPVLAVCVSLLLVGGCSGTSNDPYAGTVTQMSAFIEQQMADNGINGVSIALVDDQQVVWAKGFGFADRENGIPAAADTEYEIGSVSKLFGGTMIMQLQDQGRLDIGDPLTRFIPDFSINQPLGFAVANPQPVTVRSILTHHSGIPGDVFPWLITLAPIPVTDYNARLVNYLKGDFLAYPANLMFDYSDTAVSLLASVIASASGQTFEAYSDRLFDTLGMDRSSFYRGSPRVAEHQARGYEHGVLQPVTYVNASTSGSVVSTVADMAKFITMVNAGGMAERGRLLQPDTLSAMLTQQNGGMPLDGAKVGLSWFLSDADLDYAGRLAWHNGATFAFTSHLEVLLEHKLGVVVLTNEVSAEGAATAIAKKALKLALREKTGIVEPAPGSPTYPALVTWDQARLDALQGVYVLSSASDASYITIRSVAGGLELRNPTSGRTSLLAPRVNGLLSTPTPVPGLPLTEFEFAEIAGRTVMFIHSAGARTLGAELYVPAAVPAAWSGRLGTYAATNWECYTSPTPLVLAVQDGMLVATGGEPGGLYVLAPLSDTLAYVRGLGRSRGAAVQIVTVEGREELQFLGVRYRKN